MTGVAGQRVPSRAAQPGSARDLASAGAGRWHSGEGDAFVVVSLRYFIIGGWIAALVLAFLFLPRLGTSASGGLSDLIPKHTPAARATADAARLFGAPLDAGVAIVQRNPHGIPAAAQDRAVRQAIAVDRGLSGRPGQLAQAARAAAALAQARLPERRAGPGRPGQSRSAGWNPAPGRGVAAGQLRRPDSRHRRTLHHRHHVPVFPARYLARQAGFGRTSLRTLVSQVSG